MTGTVCWASGLWGWRSTPGCAAVFLTEALAAPLQEEIDRYKEALTPAIVLIPGKGGSLGLGETALHNAVERAVGADIT